MPGYGVVLAFAFAAVILVGVVTSIVFDLGSGVAVAVVAALLVPPFLSLAYLFASHPEMHRHQHRNLV